MRVIREFDPWDGEYCTCPKKYSINPYTGCGHGCIYCYATYIPNFFQPRRKDNLVKRVEKDLEEIPEGSIISLSNSSDPYTPMDREFRDTRKCLELFTNYDLRILIVTKSDIFLRDIDLLKELRSAVTMTITTLEEEKSQKLEPGAPGPERRLETISRLEEEGIPTGIRLDPIFPKLTENEIETIVKKASKAGAQHITTSTFKPRKDGWSRFKKSFPKTAEKVKTDYFDLGRKINNSYYLPEETRLELVKKVREECEKHQITFSTCREGLSEMESEQSCDGSHLIR